MSPSSRCGSRQLHHIQVEPPCFPSYHFFCIAANDIRTKRAEDARAKKKGLLDDKNRSVRNEHRDDTITKFTLANAYLNASNPAASPPATS